MTIAAMAHRLVDNLKPQLPPFPHDERRWSEPIFDCRSEAWAYEISANRWQVLDHRGAVLGNVRLAGGHFLVHHEGEPNVVFQFADYNAALSYFDEYVDALKLGH